MPIGARGPCESEGLSAGAAGPAGPGGFSAGSAPAFGMATGAVSQPRRGLRPRPRLGCRRRRGCGSHQDGQQKHLHHLKVLP
jgi:hypothetical protein